MEVNFYNFAKMSIHEEFPTKQRIGKKDPIKYKHRMFYKGASLQQIQSIERSTSPGQIQELTETLESVNVQNSVIVGNINGIRESIAEAQQVLNQFLHGPTPLVPATTVNDTDDTVVEAAVAKDEQADLAVWVVPEETHTLPATETMSVATPVQTSDDIPCEFEMLEPNKEDVAMMFFGVPVNGMEANMIELPVSNATFECNSSI